jgi:hypothetical protein
MVQFYHKRRRIMPKQKSVEALEARAQQLEAQAQTLRAQASAKARKDRTRTLIQIGGLLTHMGVDSLDKAQTLQLQAEAHPDWWAILTQPAEDQKDPS